MNVSIDGLACRIPTSSADLIMMDQCVQVVFRLQHHEEPFVLQGCVKSKLPAGTADHLIVGLHFLHADQGSQQARLQAALQQLC